MLSLVRAGICILRVIRNAAIVLGWRVIAGGILVATLCT